MIANIFHTTSIVSLSCFFQNLNFSRLCTKDFYFPVLSHTGCNKKNGPPRLQNFPLLDYFPCNFSNFDCHCVLQTYTKEFTFISFCQKFSKNAWKNGLRGVQILVRGSIFFVTPCNLVNMYGIRLPPFRMNLNFVCTCLVSFPILYVSRVKKA